MTALGVVTGLKAEARLLRRQFGGGGKTLIATAPGAAARGAAEKLAERGAAALLSFGIAGGLDPRLIPGTVILAERICGPGSVYPVDEAWRRRIAASLENLHPLATGAIAGRDRPISTVVEKSTLHAASKAIAVDMESHLIAEVAIRRGLGFMAIRAVADPASRAVPAAALAAAGSDGSIRLGALVAGLCRRPGDVLSLWGLARDYRAAMEALGRAAAEAASALRVG